jgi:hypothetical protein
VGPLSIFLRALLPSLQGVQAAASFVGRRVSLGPTYDLDWTQPLSQCIAGLSESVCPRAWITASHLNKKGPPIRSEPQAVLECSPAEPSMINRLVTVKAPWALRLQGPPGGKDRGQGDHPPAKRI